MPKLLQWNTVDTQHYSTKHSKYCVGPFGLMACCYSQQCLLCIRTTYPPSSSFQTQFSISQIVIMPPRRRQVRDKCPTCGKFKGKGVPCRFCAARQAQATNTASQQPPTPSAPSSPPASSQPQLPHPQEPQTQDVPPSQQEAASPPPSPRPSSQAPSSPRPRRGANPSPQQQQQQPRDNQPATPDVAD
ncbi:hypothetical protein FOZ62_025718, partial [Perkinsus olseni]